MTDAPLFDVIDKTWPAARMLPVGPWILRDGQGGGKRVSAATANGHVGKADIPLAEAGLAMAMEATVEEMEAAMHPHPTLSEGVAEGALSSLGRAIHV